MKNKQKDLENFKDGVCDALLKGISADVAYDQRHNYKEGYEFGMWLYIKKESFGILEEKDNGN